MTEKSNEAVMQESPGGDGAKGPDAPAKTRGILKKAAGGVALPKTGRAMKVGTKILMIVGFCLAAMVAVAASTGNCSRPATTA